MANGTTKSAAAAEKFFATRPCQFRGVKFKTGDEIKGVSASQLENNRGRCCESESDQKKRIAEAKKAEADAKKSDA